MTVVKINAITVGPGSGDELAQRFAARAGAVDGADGFEGFELLRPTDERLTWLVVTRWRDEESFQAWLSSRAFQSAHPAPAGSGSDTRADSHPDADSDSDSDSGRPGAARRPPVGMSAELWGYEVVHL